MTKNKKITMKKKVALTFIGLLDQVKDTGNFQFKYFVTKNIKVMKSMLETFEELRIEAMKHREPFDNEIREMVTLYAEKDAQGNIIQVGTNGFNIKLESETPEEKAVEQTVKTKEIQEKSKALEEKYKDVLIEFAEKDKALGDILNEDTELELRTINTENIPDSINSEIIDILIDLDIMIES